MKFILIPILLFHSLSSLAQIREIDSLRASLAKLATLPNYEADTNYLNTLNELSLKYQRQVLFWRIRVLCYVMRLIMQEAR